MSGLKILQEDIKKSKESTAPLKKVSADQNKSQEEKTVTGNINISFTLNPSTGEYTFLYSINGNVIETVITKSISEGLDHIFEMAKVHALKFPSEDTKPKKRKIENEKEPKIKSLF